jgi:hypothetical protein
MDDREKLKAMLELLLIGKSNAEPLAARISHGRGLTSE